MENQRLFLYLALGFLGLLIWQTWLVDYAPQPVPSTVISDTSEAPAAPSAPSADAGIAAPVAPGASPASPSSAVPVVSQNVEAAGTVVIDTPLVQARLSLQGGDLVELLLKKYPVSLEQADQPFVLLGRDIDRYFTTQSLLHGNDALPGDEAVFRAERSRYELVDGEMVIPLSWQGEGVRVVKEWVFRADTYELGLRYRVFNEGSDPLRVGMYAQLLRNEPESSGGLGTIYSYTGGVISSPDDIYEKYDFGDMRDADLQRSVDDGWVAMIEHYFGAALIPEAGKRHNYYTRHLAAQQLHVIGIVTSWHEAAANSSADLGMRLYVGPKVQSYMEAVAPNLRLTVDFGYVSVLAEPLFWLLQKIHQVLGNWGWSIVVLTIMIKAVFYWPSKMSYVSMARMRKLTPKIQKLRESYGDDRTKLGQATMELYKKEKVNPLGGCLPMLIQIPVFISLYWMLAESVELRQAPWAFWIHDLSLKDPYYILPLFMGVTMFIQSKLNPPPADPIQAKVMLYMPVLFTVFFFFFPAGLVLYWCVNNTLTILQQWTITRRIERQG